MRCDVAAHDPIANLQIYRYTSDEDAIVPMTQPPLSSETGVRSEVSPAPKCTAVLIAV